MITVQLYRNQYTVFLEFFSDGKRWKLSRVRREIVYRDVFRVKNDHQPVRTRVIKIIITCVRKYRNQ